MTLDQWIEKEKRLNKLTDAVERAGLVRQDSDGNDIPVAECSHKHELGLTGGLFFQSLGVLKCANCGGFQLIKHRNI